AYRGRPVTSSAVLDYLEKAKGLQGKDRTQVLLHYFQYLDHRDPTVAGDAFLEFAKSSDQEIGQAARHLAPDNLRGLLDDPKTPPERLGIFALLLGACGSERDAQQLRAMIERPTDRTVAALDGLLGGYIHLRPREGWDLVVAILADPRRSFAERYA